jgi:hypothetical protein
MKFQKPTFQKLKEWRGVLVQQTEVYILILFSLFCLVFLFYVYKKYNYKNVKSFSFSKDYFQLIESSLVGWSKRKIKDEKTNKEFFLMEYCSGETLFSFSIKEDFICFFIYNPKIEDFTTSGQVKMSIVEDGNSSRPIEYQAHPIEKGWAWFVPFSNDGQTITEHSKRMIRRMWTADSLLIMCSKNLIGEESLSTKAITEPMVSVIHLNKTLSKDKILKSISEGPF